MAKKIFVIVMLAVFLALFGFAHSWLGSSLEDQKRLEEIGVALDAELVEIAQSRSNKSTTYAPVVAYQVEGKSYRLASSLFTNDEAPFPANIGEKMPIKYNPQNPEEATFVGEYGAYLHNSTEIMLLVVKVMMGIVVFIFLFFIFKFIRTILF
ncbi:DUF3592 domain-containing protein [Hugenholtzia roseola]|uniref:DUF3592 domain-containing protein n=1 Tax=Hugenholtzia roseola TaxID=1002 RepID=UPI00040239DB|nr:DUF3592 domain-containing protein [Hugenholtzia roseola]